MKISVITVCFNSAATIAETLSSVANQTHKDIEHWIIDGGSRDGTLDIVRSWTLHPLRFSSEPDRGLYDAMNKGLSRFEGDVVGFLNSDDRYASEGSLAAVAAHFTGSHKADCVYADLRLTDSHRRLLRHWSSGPYVLRRRTTGWLPPHPTFYVTRALAQRVGYFDLRYRIAADCDWMMRALHASEFSPAYIPEVLVDMVSGGASTANWKAVLRANREVHAICEANRVEYPTMFVAGKLLRKLGDALKTRLRPEKR